MLNAITLSQIYVLDQDEALDFYVGKESPAATRSTSTSNSTPSRGR
jgi:hypothetical protein